ncbi:hypothetical protein GQ457_14G017030 [Hibiscus cannabinus]
MSMKEMFDQFLMNLKQGQPVVQAVAAPSRAPIDKLVQHRVYPFAGTIEEKPEEAEYWLEHITHIVTEHLSCSDEHKLECAVALLVDEALRWWELQRNNTSMQERRSSCTSSKVVNLLVSMLVSFASTTNIAQKHEEKVVDRKLKDPGVIIYQDLNQNGIGAYAGFSIIYAMHVKVLAQPPAESSFTPPVRNESSKQVQFENQGRGKGNYSKASTHQKSRAPVRVYHIEGRNNEKSLEVITEGPIKILDREIKRLGNKSVPLVKVLWKNHRVEVTWETEATMQEQYPHLFDLGKNSRMNSLFKGGL